MSPSAVPIAVAAPLSGQQKDASPAKPTTTSSSKPTPDPIPAWVKPDLTRLFRVEHLPGAFAARSVSLVSLAPNAVFARITNPTPSTCAYTSVQASKTLHIELNSDLVFINHSCRPTLIFDMAKWEVRVHPKLTGGLKKGDELTFFYPSTEWHMSQPFDCRCKEKECIGQVTGAVDMDEGTLAKYVLNAHITKLLEEKKAASTTVVVSSP